MIKPYFKHDVNSLANNERLRALVRKFGAKGYAAYFLTLENLFKNNGEPIRELALEMMCEDLRLKVADMKSILDYAASDACCHLFCKNEQGLYYSEEVEVEININQELSKKRAKAGAAGGKASKKEASHE